MLIELKKLTFLLLISVTCCCLLLSPTPAAEQPPAAGTTLPSIKLFVPDDPQAKSYLGLSGGKHFTIPQIEAQAIVIEIFNMY